MFPGLHADSIALREHASLSSCFPASACPNRILCHSNLTVQGCEYLASMVLRSYGEEQQQRVVQVLSPLEHLCHVACMRSSAVQ